MKFIIPLFASALLFSNCYKPVSGCLEIEATNFQATADENCCCEYPKLVFSVEQNFDTLVYIPDQKYRLKNGEWLRIKAITFYLSDFQLVQQAQVFEVPDTAHLQTFPDGKESVVKNDVIIVRRTPSELSAGEFLQNGDFSAINFRVGLTDDANKVRPTAAPQNHPLRAQPDKMWESESEGYRFMMMAFARDTTQNAPSDTIYWTKKDIPLPKMTGSGDFQHLVGKDFELKLKIDFAKWFDGVKLSDSDNLQLKPKIIANLPGSFSVSQ